MSQPFRLALLLFCLVEAWGFLDEYSPQHFSHRPRAPSPVPTAQINSAAIDQLVQSVQKCRHLPAVSLSVLQLDRNDNTIAAYQKGYGTKNPTDSSAGAADSHSRFCLGSMTKQFTAALLGKLLLDKGFKRLYDTPLSQLVDAGKEGAFFNLSALNSDVVTVRDFLAHRMGIPRYDFAWIMGINQSRNSILRKIHGLIPLQPVSGEFRSSFVYNNWMFSFAGFLAETLAGGGQSWEQLIHTHFFQPLNMTTATFLNVPQSDWTTFALPGTRIAVNASYAYWRPPNLDWFQQSVNMIAAAGSICASAEDLGKYQKFILAHSPPSSPLLPPKILYKYLMAPSNSLYAFHSYSRPQFPALLSSDGYGMGFIQGFYRGYPRIAHGGHIYGYFSYIYFYPELRTSIFLSTSVSIWGGMDMTETLQDGIFDLLFSMTPWVTSTSACTTYPNAFLNTTGWQETCQFPANSALLSGAPATYLHPVFGKAVVSATQDNKLRLQYGTFGTGYLCHSNFDSATTLRIYFDQTGPFWLFALPVYAVQLNTTITFNFNANGNQASSLTFWTLQPSAPQGSLDFFRQHGGPCAPSPCLHGGSCVVGSGGGYVCYCHPGFEGNNCQIDLQRYYGVKTSGVQVVYPGGPSTSPLQVYCDMATGGGGWTVVQRRVDGSTSFNRGWAEYSAGFGSPGGNYWLGLDPLRSITNFPRNYALRVSVADCQGRTAFETYQGFSVGSATSNYTLNFTPNSGNGTAGDSLQPSFSFGVALGQPFSTPDRDNDRLSPGNCARSYQSGWWFRSCYWGNLNGVYQPQCGYSSVGGVLWLSFAPRSLASASLAIKYTSPLY